MKLAVDWLQDFVAVPDDVSEVAARLGTCGFSVEGIEGSVVEFEITANRPDCLSVYGLAREAATAFDLPLRAYPAATPTREQAPVKVSIDDAGCGRYVLAVADVKVAPSPDWLATRLLSVGVRPINNVVDVTNYLMLEFGHPMHAFDATKLAGPEIRVRRARKDETLTTLDGVTRTLDDTMLVIADRDRAVAVAGVMGGRASEVSNLTTRIVLESAWFLPPSVRATSRKLGLKTEASARFERGADLDAPLTAMSRALALLADIGAGTPVGGVSDVGTRAVTPRTLTLDRDRLRRLLGVEVPTSDVARILTALGFNPVTTVAGWQVTVPSHRVDVSRDADLVEEVGRHWGFDRIPATFPALKAPPEAAASRVARGRLLRRLLCGAGYQEAVTFTFIEDVAAAPYASEADRVAIRNPLSEKFAVLRPSLAPGLVESLAYNLNRQAANVRLFEIGAIFGSVRGEREALGWVVTGSRGEHWSGSAGHVQFSDTMGVAELVTRALGVAVEVERADDLDWLARGQAARLVRNGSAVGWVGRLAAPRGISDEIFAGEIYLDALGGELTATPATIEPLARFPSIVRDLSIVVDDVLPAAEVRGTIRTNASPALVAIEEFDRYQGKGMPEGRVSLSLRLTFRSPDRTLTDAEVQRDMDALVVALEKTYGATLRGR